MEHFEGGTVEVIEPEEFGGVPIIDENGLAQSLADDEFWTF